MCGVASAKMLRFSLWLLLSVVVLVAGSKYKSPAQHLKLNRYLPPPSSASKSVLKIPIQSSHQIQFRDYASDELNVNPQIVEVMARSVPLSLIFHSASSDINIQHVHESSKNPIQTKNSYSEDEPHLLKHTVAKPMYQFIHEFIVPYRKLIQEVKPVQQLIETQIATAVKPESAEATLYGHPLHSMEYQPILYFTPALPPVVPALPPIPAVPAAPAAPAQPEIPAQPELYSDSKPPTLAQPAYPIVDSKPEALYSVSGFKPEALAQSAYSVSDFKPEALAYQPSVNPMAFLESMQPASLSPKPLAPASTNVYTPVLQPSTSAELNETHQETLLEAADKSSSTLLPAPNSLLQTYLQLSKLSAQDLVLPIFPNPQATIQPVYGPKPTI